MKFLLAILFLLFTQLGFSQRQKKLQPDEDPATLAQQLIANATSERQKVTSIFRWVTDNISYKLAPTTNYKRNGTKRGKTGEEEDDTAALKPLNVRIAEQVLKERMGVCNGYARLFTTLCDYAGIRSELITGYAKSDGSKPGRFGVNHYWNAVMIDSLWYLLDPTWASGYINHGEFYHSYDARYFLASPKTFILDHYPDDIRWTLLDDPSLPGEFHSSPFKQKSFIKYKITSYFPSNGIIEAAVGDTLHLVVETANAQRDYDVVPDLLIDSTIFSHSDSWAFVKPETDSIDPNKFNYNYTITSPGIEWLYLIYNDDLLLRYKIKAKKETASR